MAKKKSIFKKIKLKKLKRDRRFMRISLGLLVLLGVAIGLFISFVEPYNQHPKSLVWAADKEVKIPNDLISFLQSKGNDCKEYRGTSTPNGVAIWGVYQVSKNKFAKIAYGCSTHLSLYIMAIKDKGKWALITPTEYFGATVATGSVPSFLPTCEIVQKYKIDKNIEPFCIKPDGAGQENKIE